jgi:hypothetical protein
MTSGYGIKISRPGFDVNTAGPNQLSFSSAYKTLKVNSSGSGTLTDSTRTITIPHNLGYVPLFMVHTTMDAGFGTSSGLFSSGDYALTPAGFSGVVGTTTGEDDLFAYADTTNLYIKAQDNFGKIVCNVSNPSNLNECLAYQYTGGAGGNGTVEAWIGHDNTLGDQYGAVRFGNVNVAQGTTVYNAQFNFKVDSRDGSGQVSATVWGIDEDNTAVFNTGTIATARTKTTASVNTSSTLTAGNSLGVNVTDIVNEILGRVGWTAGNSLGIMAWNNGTTGDNAYFEQSGDSTLSITPTETIASYKYTIFLNQLE